MGISLSVYNFPAREALDVAVAADEFGFDAIFCGEHIFSTEYSSPRATGYGNAHNAGEAKPNVIDPTAHLLDPWVTLGAIASATTRLRLATGVVVLPLRHPLLVAHHAASLHQFSNGRFMLGVGSGWMSEEFDAMDMPFTPRGARMDEALQILRLAQSGSEFSYQGEHYAFKTLQLSPSPTPYPIVIGGNSKRALRRAAEYGDAWFTSGSPNPDDAIRLRDELAAQRQKLGRTDDFKVFIRTAELDEAVKDRYASEGISDLVVWGDRIWTKGAPVETNREAIAELAHRFGLA